MRGHHKTLRSILLGGVLTLTLGAIGAMPAAVAQPSDDTPAAMGGGAATAEAARARGDSDQGGAIGAAGDEDVAANDAGDDTGDASADTAGSATADSSAGASASTDSAEAEATATASAEASPGGATSSAGTSGAVSVDTEDAASARTKSWSKSISTKFGSIALSRTMSHAVTEDGTRVMTRSHARALALATPGVTKADTRASADVKLRDVTAGMANAPQETTAPDSFADTAGFSEPVQ